jgi:hypothetical protein
MKSTISELKNTLERIYGRLDNEEEKVIDKEII